MGNQDKTLYKDVSNTIKIAIGYHKISYVTCCKLAQIRKELIINLSSTSSLLIIRSHFTDYRF